MKSFKARNKRGCDCGSTAPLWPLAQLCVAISASEALTTSTGQKLLHGAEDDVDEPQHEGGGQHVFAEPLGQHGDDDGVKAVATHTPCNY